jgi:hypothetical protein
MSQQSFAPGGLVYGPPVMVTIEDDECVLGSDLTHCVRTDQRHHHEMVEIRSLCAAVRREVAGACIHRHVVAVDSVVDGLPLARLCLNCDAQLPA